MSPNPLAKRAAETTCSPSAVLNSLTPWGPPSGDADIRDRRANQGPCIAHQHDLVRTFDRERRDYGTVALGRFDIDDPLPAPACRAVFVGRGALSVAVFRDAQNELLGLPRTARSSQARARSPRRRRLSVRPAFRIGVADIGVAGPGIERRVAQDRHRDDAVFLAEPHPANAGRCAAAEHPDLVDGKADAFSASRREQDVLVGGAGLDAHPGGRPRPASSRSCRSP